MGVIRISFELLEQKESPDSVDFLLLADFDNIPIVSKFEEVVQVRSEFASTESM